MRRHSARLGTLLRASVAALTVTVLVGVLVAVAPPGGPAEAGPGDGALTVRAIRDFNGNGAYEPAIEVGVAGAPITVTDDTGATAAATTGADGSATVNLGTVTGGRYRVQVEAPAGSVLQPAPATTAAGANALRSWTSFVNVSNNTAVNLTVGMWNPADYCQANPLLVTACQRGTWTGHRHPKLPSGRSLVTFPYTARAEAATTPISTQGATGTVHGIAYRKQDQRIFSGAIAKRITEYGPLKAGGVYVTNRTTGVTTNFTTVPNAGTTAHNEPVNVDGAFFNVPGREALGDLEISEDGSKLYVVNLNNKTLYVYDATLATATAALKTVPIPNPACPGGEGNWRPFGLGVRDSVLYVGGVCSGESSQQLNDVQAVVQTFNTGTDTFNAGEILRKTLNFERGNVAVADSDTGNRWRPWNTTWTPTVFHVNPQPMLADIAIEADGDLVLGFRDRWGDMWGHDAPPPTGGTTLYGPYAGGDLNRACLQGGAYVWEGTNAQCPNNRTAANSGGEPATVVEYYPGEFRPQFHLETSQGAIALPLQQTRMAVTGYDTDADLFTNGVAWFDRNNGTAGNTNGLDILDNTSEGFGKQNGLGDLEVLCDLAPVQIGNRAWFDTDADGVQDPSEPALAGVQVQLVNAAGAVVSTKVTNAAGEYYFGTADGLAPATAYTLRFSFAGVNTAPLPGSPPLAALRWTVKDGGSDDRIDSDVVPASGEATVTTGPAGSVNHTLDAGVVAAINKVGDYVWIDADRDGVQDTGETPVPGVDVIVKNPAGATVGTDTTDANGLYLVENLPDGTYTVCFDLTALPDAVSDYRPTTPNAGTDDALDSDASLTDGCAPPTELDIDKRQDLTLDLGLVPPLNRIGNFVWVDADRDGVQDTGETPVPGVDVIVKNPAGATVGTDTTDANGLYLVENLPDGTYTVCFDLTALPDAVSDYTPTTQNTGTNDAVDSDASPADGCTGPVTVGSGAREDLTVDMGLIPPLNSLGDYVWIDADRDGVQDPTETPVEGVPVMVRDAGGTSVDTAFTDATGKYTFTDLPDGSYDVCFNLSALPPAVDDYVPTTKDAGANDALDSDADQGTGCTPQVPLGPGQRSNTTLDLGLVSPLNSLGDYVWIDADKDGVQDPTETDVQGVIAKAMSADGREAGTDTTDADGLYLITGLPDGTYTVCFDIVNLPAAVDDYTVTTKDAGGNDAADSDGDPTTGCTGPVTLGLGARQNLTLDLGLIAPPNSLGDYAWADTDKDGVQDTGEPPVPGVVATAMSGTTVMGTDTTDATGKYLIEDLPDGTYTVCFDLSSVPVPYSDYVPTLPNVGTDDAVDSDGDPATLCTEPVELGTNKRQNLTLDLGLVPPVNRIGDYVWIDADKDGVQDPTETAVDGVPVRLMNQAGEQVGTDTTEDGGKYLFDDVPNGTYTVCFDLANMPAAVEDYTPTTPDAGGDDEADSDAGPTGCTGSVTVGEGNRENFTLDLGLVAPPNSLGDYVWIDADRDGVQDPTETPVAGVVANAMVGTTVVGTDTTDANGKYLIDDLPDGTYTVCFDLVNLPAAVDDYTVTTKDAGSNDGVDSDADPASGCTAPVTLGVNKRQDLTLDLGLVAPVNTLGDYVWVDADKDGVQDEGEKPVAGVKVTVKDGEDTVVGTDTTDATGKYLFENLPDGRYTVCFDLANLPDAVGDYTATTPNTGADDTVDSDAAAGTGCAEPVELGVNKRQNLTVDAGLVAPPNQLGDRVWSDEDKDGVQDPGEPGVPDVPVTVRSGDTVVATDTTDADGNYLVENLPDGTYTVCFDLSDLPAPYTGYIVTVPNAGADATDSDASPATACAESVELGVDKRQNLTVDAGIRPEANRITGGTWFDRDRDGVRDGGEPLIPGVPVVLRDENGTVIGTARTGADGTVTFYDVVSGKYRLCYGVKNLPKPYGDTKLTASNVGNESYDSDAVSPSGCTELVYVGPGGRGKRVDAGYVRPASGLPVTGASLIGLVGVGIVVLSTGFMLVLAAVRRRRETA